MASAADIIKPGMRCAFYMRYSTIKQDKIAQLDNVERFVERNKCKIVATYEEPGVSATKTKFEERDGLQRMLYDVAEDKFDFVAVYKRDRLARDTIDHERIRAAMRTANKHIIVTSENGLYDEEDVISRLTKDGLTAFESALISERTRDVLDTIIRKGRWPGGLAPYGYRYDKRTRKFSVVTEEQLIVRQIFELYEQGVSGESIAKLLPKGSRKGKDWSKQTILGVIENPFYAGYIVWGRRPHRELYLDNPEDDIVVTRYSFTEPAVSREVWERCFKIKNERRNRKRDPKFLRTNFLLREFVYCKHCKVKDTDEVVELEADDQRSRRNGKTYGDRVYRCPSCGNKCVTSILDDKVTIHLRSHLKTHDMSTVQLLQEGNTRDLQQVQDMREQLCLQREDYVVKEQELEKIIRARYQQQQNDRNKSLLEVLTYYRRDLIRKMEQIDSQPHHLENQETLLKKVSSQEEYWKSPTELLDKQFSEMTNVDWRRLVTEMVQSVLVDKKGGVTLILKWGETTHLSLKGDTQLSIF